MLLYRGTPRAECGVSAFAAVVPLAWDASPRNLCGRLPFIVKIWAYTPLLQKTCPDPQFKVLRQLLCISQDSSSVVIAKAKVMIAKKRHISL